MLPVGHPIQHYEILAPLGSGGFADVYRVRHLPSGEQRALKWLRPEHRSADVLARFQREAEIQRGSQHPGVVPVLEILSEEAGEEGVGLVMALYEGGSLEGLLAGRSPGDPLPSAVLRRLFLPLLEGLGPLHDRGVIHRDIKPGNILLRRDAQGHLEGALTDFGIAHAPTPGPRMTRDGQRMGTLEYMSPEQRLNPRAIDHRTDIYALGAALCEAATLQTPDLDTPHLTATVPGDPHLTALLRRALHPDREQRFPSCADMAEALRHLPLPSSPPLDGLLARLEALEQQQVVVPARRSPVRVGLLGGELALVALGGSLLAAGGAPPWLTPLAMALGGGLIGWNAAIVWRPLQRDRLLSETVEVMLGGLLSVALLAGTWPSTPALPLLLLLWGLVPTTLIVLRLALPSMPALPLPLSSTRKTLLEPPPSPRGGKTG